MDSEIKLKLPSNTSSGGYINFECDALPNSEVVINIKSFSYDGTSPRTDVRIAKKDLIRVLKILLATNEEK